MSSTNRGGKRSPSDNYPTPPYCAHRLLEDPYARENFPSGKWLEPGAGDGAIIRAVNEVRQDIVWTALELREECKEDLTLAVGPRGLVVIEDFLTPPVDSKLDSDHVVALGNPPFRLAGEFIERSLEVASVVCLLLRINFLASARRNPFMRSHTPDILVLPNRPSFRGQGTDSPEYAWFAWHRGQQKKVGKLIVLNTTSIKERNAGKIKTLGIEGKRERTKRSKLPTPRRADERVILDNASI